MCYFRQQLDNGQVYASKHNAFNQFKLDFGFRSQFYNTDFEKRGGGRNAFSCNHLH